MQPVGTTREKQTISVAPLSINRMSQKGLGVKTEGNVRREKTFSLLLRRQSAQALDLDCLGYRCASTSGLEELPGNQILTRGYDCTAESMHVGE